MKKVLLASLMVSVMGLSSLFAEDKKETKVESLAACGCPHPEGEVKRPVPVDEEEVNVSVATPEEDVTIKAVSCSECDKGDKLADEEAEEFSIV
jgi:hypothetical protein